MTQIPIDRGSADGVQRSQMDARAYGMAQRCLRTHGLWIDPEQFRPEADGAASSE